MFLNVRVLVSMAKVHNARFDGGPVLDEGELLTAGQLAELQLSRLRWTVRHAYENVVAYRTKFDAAGVSPDDVHTLDDLRRFPFTTKEDLRQNYPFGMFAVPSNQVVRIHASSGTTGKPTVGGLGAHAGLEKLGATVIPVSGGQTARQVQLIQDFLPEAIMCTPSYLLTIADAMEEVGMDPRSSSLRVAVLGAEPWTEQMRHELEERLAIDAVDIYGLSEVMGPGVGNECVETKDGPHIWEDHFYPEVIDAETGEVLPDGAEGELVFTSLTKEAFPVIRYRTRDLTRLLPGTARPTMRRIAKIVGRNDDMIILRGVNLFPTQIEEIVLGMAELSPHFILELRQAGRMESLTVKIERRGEVSVAAAAEGGKLLVRRIKESIGTSVQVSVVDPGTLPRSEGKLKRLYDLR
jgi:phenylacetate-CoA ligase